MPVYEQLADWLRQGMDTGRFPPGRPLPSKKRLKDRWNVSGGTVDKAMRILRGEGRIETVKGKGLYVRPRDDLGGAGLRSDGAGGSDLAAMPPDPFGTGMPQAAL